MVNQDASKVTALLQKRARYPLEINWRNQADYGKTALHHACQSGLTAIVRELLAQPDIDVNIGDEYDTTPLSLACQWDRLESVQLLLDDPRTEVNRPDKFGCTPLWRAASRGGGRQGKESEEEEEEEDGEESKDPGGLEVIKRFIASGRVLDLERRGYGKTTPEEVAASWGYDDAAALLRNFVVDPTSTRKELAVRK